MKRQKTRQSNKQAGQHALLSPKVGDGGQGEAAAGMERYLLRLRRHRWIFGLFLVAATVVAYQPVWHAGFIWDDDCWTTNLSALFQDTSGLRLIWFQPTALQQYYPLSGTTFWLDYQLWGFWTTALSRGERPAARPSRVALLAVVAPAPTARRLAGGCHLRASSGHGRIRRLDHRTQECALVGLLPRRIVGL